jgi:hypothetical protein
MKGSSRGFDKLPKLATYSEECAVCIPGGAKLLLHGSSAILQKIHGFSATEAVTFRQLSANMTYRDALEFENGVKLCLQELEEGQTVDVLALSSDGPVPELRWNADGLIRT